MRSEVPGARCKTRVDVGTAAADRVEGANTIEGEEGRAVDRSDPSQCRAGSCPSSVIESCSCRVASDVAEGGRLGGARLSRRVEFKNYDNTS